MQDAPVNYESIYKEGDYTVEYKVNIDGVDYDQSQIWSINTDRIVITGESKLIGNAMIGQIDLTITKPSVQFSRMACIKPYIRLYSNRRGVRSGWLQKGEFFIDTRSCDETDRIDTLQIHGYDAMRKANKLYPSSTLTWGSGYQAPQALWIVREIASAIGVEIDQNTSDYLWITKWHPAFPAQYTMAEMLGSIAAMYGGNFVISDNGKLRLVLLLDAMVNDTSLLVNEIGRYITFGGNRIIIERDV